MTLWNTPAGRAATPFDNIDAPSFREMLRKLREADPNNEQLAAGIADARAEADRPLSAPLTAADLHTPIGKLS